MSDESKITTLTKAVLFCATFTILFIALSLFKSFFPGSQERIAHAIVGTIAAILTTFLFLKFDRKTFADIGFVYKKPTLKNFVVGLFTGICLMGLLSYTVILFSGFKVETNAESNLANFILCTLPLIPLAFMEEVGFRGYPLIILKNSYNTRNTILITSFLFALYHIANGWTLQNAFLGAGVWGILFGLAAIYSNGIALPTGLHYGVNATTAAFGISDNSFNIWTLKQSNGLSLESYQSSKLETLLPQVGILVIGVVLMERFHRKKTEDIF